MGCFDIDANGIVNVSAKDKATGKEQNIQIRSSGGLSDADIEKMVNEAEAFAADDKSKKEMTEDKNEIETALKEVREAMTGDDVEVLKEKTSKLSAATMKIGQAVYGKAGEGDSTVDADSEEKKKAEEKK